MKAKYESQDVWPHLADGLLDDLEAERARQEAKFPGQKLPNGTGGAMHAAALEFERSEFDVALKANRLTWVEVLREEVAESFAESDPANLRAELIQVAAVCLRWISQIDRTPGTVEEWAEETAARQKRGAK